MKTPRSISRNPWPFALIGVFAVFITLVAMFITFAVAQDMDLVQPDYYAQEVRYQDRIDSQNRTRHLQPPVRISFDAARQVIEVLLPPAHAASQPAGNITFYRPSNARLDHNVALSVEPGTGLQAIPCRDMEGGLWKVEVAWQHEGLDYFKSESVVLP